MKVHSARFLTIGVAGCYPEVTTRRGEGRSPIQLKRVEVAYEGA